MSVRSRIHPRPRAIPSITAMPARSRHACPVCGAHRVAIVRLPRIDVLGVQPYTDLFGMGDQRTMPGLECRACGAAWRDLHAFLAGTARA